MPPFAYYQHLSPAEKEIYRRSEAVRSLRLPASERLQPLVATLAQALAGGERGAITRATTGLGRELARALGAPPVEIQVLEVRPRDSGEELHGLYTLSSRGRARIRVWMRTAAQGRVVAFRTFLRTLLHELCHHVDFTVLDLDPSFHTRGFFQRESSLFRQLVPSARRRSAGSPAPDAAPPEATPTEAPDFAAIRDDALREALESLGRRLQIHGPPRRGR